MKSDRKYWLDNPRNVTRIVYALFGVCVALLVSDFFYHKHTYFLFEGWWGFFGLFGFGVFLFIVMAGKWLRKILMRDEDYYDH